MPILRSLLVGNQSVDRKFVCILQNQSECLCEFNLQRFLALYRKKGSEGEEYLLRNSDPVYRQAYY